MRLLVTRPEPDGERTAAKLLRAQGHEVMLAPLLRIEAIAGCRSRRRPWARGAADQRQRRAGVGRSIRGVQELLALPVLAVGRSSAEAARAAGFADVESADGDGGDLAQLAAQRFAGSDEAVALSRRARTARATCRRSGSRLTVETVVVYRAVKADKPAARRPGGASGRPDRRRAAFFPAQRRDLPRMRAGTSTRRRWRRRIIACRRGPPSRS